MSQDYKLTAFNPGDFQDPHGNTWCDAAFEGLSEPVKMVVKDPTQYKEGQMLYGEITVATSRAGKPYNRFKRQQKPDQEQSYTPKAEKKEWQPRDDMAIRAQWAIGQAVQLYGILWGRDKTPWEPHWAEKKAKEFYLMVDRVKGQTPEKSKASDDWTPPTDAELAVLDAQAPMPAGFLQD